VKKYNQSDKARISLLNTYSKQQRTETAILQPLYHPKYITITDLFRILTGTFQLPSDMSDMPLFIGDIGEVSDWRNNHLKHGLGLNFSIVRSTNEELSKSEIDSIKICSTKSYETNGFRFYILDNFIYYQLDTALFEKQPEYVYLRIKPFFNAVLKNKDDRVLFFDFKISDYKIRSIGNYSGYENQMFIKKEITKFPIKRIETGFYNVIEGKVEYSQNVEIEF
jgi:hypothetical protein